MSPRHLRAKIGLSSAELAEALGMTEGSLRSLEATPLQAWRVGELASYMRALGHRVRFVAVRNDGHEEELA